MKGLTDDLWACLAFITGTKEGMQVNGVVHRVKRVGVGDDGIVKMVSLSSTIDCSALVS